MEMNIEFDKPNGEYNAGDSLQGVVLVTQANPKQITDIKVLVTGKGKVLWSEKKGFGRYSIRRLYRNKETYLNELIDIQPRDGNRFPFSIKLPSNLPESFESLYGKVKYKAKCTVTSSNHKKTKKFPFAVHALVPIPGHLKELATVKGTKNMRSCSELCCCISSGTVSIKLEIDKGGYLPNEPIRCNAEISNKSSSKLEIITLSTIQQIRWISSGGHAKVSEKKIDPKFTYQGVLPAGDFLAWSTTVNVGPIWPPTNLGTCKIMEVKYFLELKIGEESGFLSPDVHFRIPFMLGNATPSSVFSTGLDNSHEVISQQPVGIAKATTRM